MKRARKPAALVATAIAATAAATVLAASPATAAQLQIPSPEQLGSQRTWHEVQSNCTLATVCVNGAWTLHSGLSVEQFVGEADRFATEQTAKLAALRLANHFTVQPALKVVKLRRKSVKLWQVTGWLPGGPFVEAIARRGKRVITLQLDGSQKLSPGLGIGVLSRAAVQLARNGGSIPLGQPNPT